MPDGGWVVLGAAVGALSSILTTWLRLRGRADYFDKEAMKLLKKKLKNGPVPWQELSTLGKNIGMNDKETKQLLLLSGAEKCEKKTPPNHWELTQRNPIERLKSFWGY